MRTSPDIGRTLGELYKNDSIRCFKLENVDEFVDIVEAHPGVNCSTENFKGGHGHNGSKWYGATYEEAKNRLLYGHISPDLTAFDLSIKQLAGDLKPKEPFYKHEIIGQVLDIGVFTTGDPECWLEPDLLETKNNLTLYIDTGATCAVTPEQMFNRGVALCALIDVLSEDYNLEIFMVGTAGAGNWMPKEVSFSLRVPSDPLDIEMVHYICTDISYSRRLFYPMCDMIGGYVHSSHQVKPFHSSLMVEKSKYFYHAAGYGYREMYKFNTIDSTKEWIKEQVIEVNKMFEPTGEDAYYGER